MQAENKRAEHRSLDAMPTVLARSLQCRKARVILCLVVHGKGVKVVLHKCWRIQPQVERNFRHGEAL